MIFSPIIEGSWGYRINLDGLAAYCGGVNGSMAYTQLFWNGSIEAVEAYWLNVGRSGGARTIPHRAIERTLLSYLTKLFDIQKGLGVNPPVVIALSLTETSGFKMAVDMDPFEQGTLVTEENLVLPETVVESFDESPGRILKPLFDLVWNACGYAKSKNFDEQGNWIGQ
jgi:hypothetical protein